MNIIKQLIDTCFLGKHRLENIDMLPLGSSLQDAIAIYGESSESKPSEDAPQITEHTFLAGSYHELVALEYEEIIQSITYWSEKSSPTRDLKWMLESYKGDSQWEVMEEGYWFQRQDKKLRIWCSAIPAIGVAFIDFLSTNAELKTAHNLQKLDDLSDITWAPNDVIWELQKRCIESNDRSLFKFANKSERIAVSEDGRELLIIRNHHGYDVDDGFMERNCPPESDGYPTQVINSFSGGSCWGKTTLPRDANVTALGFNGSDFFIDICQTTTERIFNFKSLDAICSLPITSGPHHDEKLWEEIEKAEAEQSES